MGNIVKLLMPKKMSNEALSAGYCAIEYALQCDAGLASLPMRVKLFNAGILGLTGLGSADKHLFLKWYEAYRCNKKVSSHFTDFNDMVRCLYGVTLVIGIQSILEQGGVKNGVTFTSAEQLTLEGAMLKLKTLRGGLLDKEWARNLAVL